MSSDDDYYVELYERHAEARRGRRARRRGSGGNGESYERRGLDKYRGQKARRSNGCVLQSSMRIAGVVFIAVIAAYELYLFREPTTMRGVRKTQVSETLFTVADEERSYGNNMRKSSDSSDGSSSGENVGSLIPGQAIAPTAIGDIAASATISKNTGERVQDHPLLTSQKEKPESSNKAGTNDKSAADVQRSSGKQPAFSSPGEKAVKSQPGSDKSSAYNGNGSSSQSIISRGTTKSKDKERTQISSQSMEFKDDSQIDSEGADSETESSEEPKKKNKPTKAQKEVENQKARRNSDRGQTRGEAKLHTGSKEVGSDPGAKENFWKWFQESKVTEGTGASSVECPEENHKLCQMFYKYARKYKIRSIFDASCGKNLAWIGVPLKKISNELWGFKYYCGEPDSSKMEEARERLKEFSFVEFDDRKWWKSGFPEGVELLFAWDTLAHTAFGRVWSFFVNVRKQDIKWVLVDNYPAIMNDPSPKRQYINLRKHPFRFPAATAVVQDVREPGEEEAVKRQLLLYEGSALPDNLG